MKIVDIEVTPIFIPIAEANPPLPEAETSAHHTLIKIRTDEGIDGIGETFRFAPWAMTDFIKIELGNLLIGQDPRDIERLWQLMYRRTFRYGMAGLVLHAISGVEIALWDILGKSVNLPVYQLLGGACREKIRAYASLHKFNEPEAVAETAKHFVDRGYSAVKLHQRDVASVAAAREAIGSEIDLMLDASGAWSAPETERLLPAFAPYNLHWIEEPLLQMDDYDGLARIRNSASMRIAAGENVYTHHGFRTMIEKKAVDLIQPDVIKTGGISVARKVLTMAEAFNLEACTHSFYYGPGMAATLHVALNSPLTEMIEVNPHDLSGWFMKPALRPVDGYLTAPDAPGLGIELDDDIIRDCAKTRP
ncbi:MAG: mandelate racemase/muconate lactonizing enzyme family protein [Rhodospirillaceae bacterium]|jgi:L-alanine-DL-glutamate epimerase-like enolase superfamily enzyme|nr:mandelate racemase/muconate lactonizing enzyme family protein [Rhodospirillaceae bacterium]